MFTFEKNRPMTAKKAGGFMRFQTTIVGFILSIS